MSPLLSNLALDISNALVLRLPLGLPVPVPVTASSFWLPARTGPLVIGPGPVMDGVRLLRMWVSLSGPVEAGPRDETLLIWK